MNIKKEEMSIKKVFLAGLSAAIAIGITKWIGDTLYSVWEPLIHWFSPTISPILQWGLGFVFTLLSIIILGCILVITAPFREIIQLLPLIRILKKRAKQIVIAEYAGDEILALVMEENSKRYKILNLSAPIPISGGLLIVDKEKTRPTSITVTDVIKQLTSFGVLSILDKLYPNEQNASKHLPK